MIPHYFVSKIMGGYKVMRQIGDVFEPVKAFMGEAAHFKARKCCEELIQDKFSEPTESA